MYHVLGAEIAAQRITELHRQAIEARLARHGRAARKRTARGRGGWKRLAFRRRRLALEATRP